MPVNCITCLRFVESLSAWHDGELGEASRTAFEAHRAGCARCAGYADAFAAAIVLTKKAMLESAAHAELPEHMTRAILAACRGTN
ncbi:MAG: anti-sigma factor family protein [Candidatus Binataceae bacterium]